jgi:hypothetical protein
MLPTWPAQAPTPLCLSFARWHAFRIYARRQTNARSAEVVSCFRACPKLLQQQPPSTYGGAHLSGKRGTHRTQPTALPHTNGVRDSINQTAEPDVMCDVPRLSLTLKTVHLTLRANAPSTFMPA